MIYTSLQFWTLIVGLLAFVIRFFVPSFPLDDTQIMAIVVMLLGLIGVVPTAKYGIDTGSIFSSLAFWTLVAGLIAFVMHYFFPLFPVDQGMILAVIVLVLSQLGINPTLRRKGLIK